MNALELDMKYLVRYPQGFALKFDDRSAHTVPDREATLFDTPTEACAAVLRCGASGAARRGLQIETVDGTGRPIELV